VNIVEKMELMEFVVGKCETEELKIKREKFVEEYGFLNLEDFHAILINRQNEF